MKKTLIILLAAVAFLSSCSKSDKCKCTITVGSVTVSDQVVERPADTKCSELKVEDIDGEVVDVDLSSLASIKCVNYQD